MSSDDKNPVEKEPPFYAEIIGDFTSLGIKGTVDKLVRLGIDRSVAEAAVDRAYDYSLKCHEDVLSIAHGYHNAVLARHQEILPGKKKGLWSFTRIRGKKRLYATCIRCGTINDITHYGITPDGFTPKTRCVTCVACRQHQWLKLDDWKGRRRKS